MQIQTLDNPAIRILTPDRYGDQRGFFSEIYNKPLLERLGVNLEFVQENYSLSREVHTVRGLHFQTPPRPQAKLIQVLRGSIYDVAVDLRRGSPWFGQAIAAEISADNWQQILIPEGFAHGFCTLEPDTAVLYKVTAPYSPEHDSGIRWDDPALGIEWPAQPDQVVLSDKDQTAPLLADYDSPFEYREDAQ